MTTIVRLLLAAAIGLGLPALSQAQTYPARPIKIIVPSPAGATTDTLVRMVAQKLSEKWGQPVIVDNRPGAGGNIGAEEAAKAAPDGYTLLFTYPAPLTVNQTLYKQLAYDPDSFVPISLIAAVPLVLAVPPKEEATTVQQLIALAKAHPGQLNFASQGYGTCGHLAGELFKSMAGIDIVHVPYKGSAPALTDLLGGRIDMMFIELSTVLPQINAGKLRALGVGSETAQSIPARCAGRGRSAAGLSGVDLVRHGGASGHARRRSPPSCRRPLPKRSTSRTWPSGSST